MKKLFMILLVGLLAACATNPVTEIVKVPVSVSCVKELPVKPEFATDSLPSEPTEFQKIQAIVLDWLAYRSYTPKLEAGLAACK